MKAKRSLLTLVAVFFVALACAFGVLNLRTKASADYVEAPDPSAIVTEGVEGFELAEKASLRLTDGKAAIKFSATVTEEFHNSIGGEATYLATITKVSDGTTKAIEFGAPIISGGKATFNAFLNFGNATPELLEVALAEEFEAAVYAKVGDVYYQANGSKEVDRSMRVVANDAFLNWTEGVGYEKVDIADLGYFTDGLRSDKTYAVVDTNNTLYVHIPGAPANAAAIYVDDVKVAATYDAVSEKYTVANFAAEGNFITVFDANGKAYSTDYATGATAIANVEELKATLGVAANLEGYYVLTSDIEVGVWTYVENKLFGTFNGLGYKLTKYKNSAHTSHNGFIRFAYGAEFKNIIMVSDPAGLTNNAGVLVGQVPADVKEVKDPDTGVVTTPAVVYGTTTFDNVIVYMPTGGWNAAPINVQQQAMSMKDCMFIVGNATNLTGSGLSYGIVYNNNTPLNCENVITVTGDFSSVAIAPQHVQGATAFAGMGELYNADQENDIVTEYQWSVLKDINAFLPVTQENYEDLRNTTISYGIHVLMEDIDLMYVDADAETKTRLVWNNPKAFNGVLDGNGHTIDHIQHQTATAGTAGIMKPSVALTVRNIGINQVRTSRLGGMFGMLNGGSLRVVNSALKIDNPSSDNSSMFGYAPQKAVYVKDSFLYFGNGQKGSVDSWLMDENAASNASVTFFGSNHLINLSGVEKMMNGALTVNGDSGVNYTVYTNVPAYMAANAQLSDMVKGFIPEIGAIQELKVETLDQAKSATGGYWYLTKDLELPADKAWKIFQYSGKLTDNYYYNANITLDGQGHKLSGIKAIAGGNVGGIVSEGLGTVTFKNLVVEADLSGMSSTSGLFVGIYRDSSASNKIVVENVFVDIIKHTDGSLFGAWTPYAQFINITNMFVNYQDFAGGYIFAGIHYKGTITLDGFMAVGAAEKSLAYQSEIVYKNAAGTTLDLVNDRAVDIIAYSEFADLATLKGSEEDWVWAQETFGALAPAFFEIEA